MNNLPNLKLMTVTKKIVPLTIIHSITLSVGVATSYVFVVYLNLGLKGSCFANICAFSVQYFAGLIYIFLIKPYPEILISLKKYDFSFLGTYIVMALPTIALMILFNVAQESIAVFLLVNYEQNYSAYLVLIQIGNIILVSAICFESSMAILVAQNSDLLSRSSLFLKIILPTFLIGNLFIIVACGIMTILYFTIEDFFNLELSVFQIIKIDFFWWMIYIFVQNNLNLMLGIFRGIGRFLFPAIFNLVVIVFITVPVSYVLTIILDWKSAGTWIAMAGGSFLNFLVLMITFIVVYNSDDELKKKE